MTTYHCTWTKLVPKILKQGLRCLQTSNWADGAGKRLGGGAVHAFANEFDAIRWAAKMDWDHNRNHGTGKVTILTIEHDGLWDNDFNDTLTRAGYEGDWLKVFRGIPPSEITGSRTLTVDMVRALIAHQNAQYQEAK